MRQIAHISDLHFGTEDAVVAEGLLQDLASQAPDLVAVSGDLTQRARKSQFVAASRFLNRISKPTIIVPGNHDIPLFNLVARFLFPLSGYNKYITQDLQPCFTDAEMLVVGVNTARSNTWKNGRISFDQIALLREQLVTAAACPFKVLVAHHPFLPPEDEDDATVVGRLPMALEMLEEFGCDLVLAGHMHRAYSGNPAAYDIRKKRSILIAQAGTAISQRRRDEPNAYNFIEYDSDQLRLEVRAWSGSKFETLTTKRFLRHAHGWEIGQSSC